MKRTGPKKPSRPTRKRNVRAVDRRARAMDMRRDGASLRAIATALGMSCAAVHETIQVGLRETIEPVSDELREMELQRLDVLWRKLQKGVNAGEADAIRAAVRVIDTRAKLLGMNAPDRHEHTGPGGAVLSLVVDTGLVKVQGTPSPVKIQPIHTPEELTGANKATEHPPEK